MFSCRANISIISSFLARPWSTPNQPRSMHPWYGWLGEPWFLASRYGHGPHLLHQPMAALRPPTSNPWYGPWWYRWLGEHHPSSCTTHGSHPIRVHNPCVYPIGGHGVGGWLVGICRIHPHIYGWDGCGSSHPQSSHPWHPSMVGGATMGEAHGWYMGELPWAKPMGYIHGYPP